MDDGVAFNALNGRVSALETHVEYVRRDLDEIKADLKDVKSTLTQLPTRQDLNAWKLQWTGLGIGVVALIVTGVIGGLGWLQTRTEKPVQPAAAPQPIIIQLPATPPPRR
jgi:hypothetical protein